MATSFVRQFVVLLFLSLPIFSKAVPFTRTKNFQYETKAEEFQHQISHLVSTETDSVERSMNRRMDVELNDYPGSGANNRHTPRPQFGRGCVDC